MSITPESKTVSLFKSDTAVSKFREILWDKAPWFVASVLSTVQNSKLLAKAEPNSVYMSAMIAASLDLPINQNLGYAYIVPYNWQAQFQMWYKWFVQLALRSNQFKKMASTKVYEWQLVSADPLQWYEFDRGNKTSDKIIWYVAYFLLKGGDWFEKYLYMTVEEIEAHWAKFSASYKYDIKQKKKMSLRSKDFDSMAEKTVLKLLLSKYAPLSIEMQTAVLADQWVIKNAESMDVEYVDNDNGESDVNDVLEWKLENVTTSSPNQDKDGE